MSLVYLLVHLNDLSLIIPFFANDYIWLLKYYSSVAALRSLYFHWPCKTQLLLFLGLGSIVVLFVLLLGLRVSNQWCETLRELLNIWEISFAS